MYKVLARKYRPDNFSDLIGQDQIINVLKGAIKSKRIPHAFIFSGVRGVGKTTTARLLARCLNYKSKADDERNIDQAFLDLSIRGEYCDEIANSSHPDVIEIDAASNTSVNDIREIIEAIKYRPLICRYKIYIIDEVHMLSNSAFNALLKTLEEPPEHVIFIFATTELNKIPATIISRCQKFNLRRIENEVIAKKLLQIIKLEKLQAEEKAIYEIAKAATGSMRDALSILEQIILLTLNENNKGDNQINEKKVREALGIDDQNIHWELLYCILKGDEAKAIDIIEKSYEKGFDLFLILQNLLLAVYETSFYLVDELKNKKNNFEKYKEIEIKKIADITTKNHLLRLWSFLNDNMQKLKFADIRIAIIMLVMQACNLSKIPKTSEILEFIFSKNSAGENNPTETNESETLASKKKNKLKVFIPKIDQELIFIFEKFFFHNDKNIFDILQKKITSIRYLQAENSPNFIFYYQNNLEIIEKQIIKDYLHNKIIIQIENNDEISNSKIEISFEYDNNGKKLHDLKLDKIQAKLAKMDIFKADNIEEIKDYYND